MGGTKFDADKPSTDLIPVFPLIEAARVFNFGAKKYGRYNWRKGIIWGRMYGAILRHLFAWWGREDLDKETELHHLDHALCELLMLRQTVEDRHDLDDRYKEEK